MSGYFVSARVPVKSLGAPIALTLTFTALCAAVTIFALSGFQSSDCEFKLVEGSLRCGAGRLEFEGSVNDLCFVNGPTASWSDVEECSSCSDMSDGLPPVVILLLAVQVITVALAVSYIYISVSGGVIMGLNIALIFVIIAGYALVGRCLWCVFRELREVLVNSCSSGYVEVQVASGFGVLVASSILALLGTCCLRSLKTKKQAIRMAESYNAAIAAGAPPGAVGAVVAMQPQTVYYAPSVQQQQQQPPYPMQSSGSFHSQGPPPMYPQYSQQQYAPQYPQLQGSPDKYPQNRQY